MSFAPTDEQRTAINVIDRSMAVTAGAGSGKTRVLVERYIHLLEEGVAIDDIAAITFTKKAAQEMRERIRRELPDRIAEVEAAQISTIHSLCQRIIREHPLQAGIDPRFRMAEEWEADALLRQTIEEIAADVEPEEEFPSFEDFTDLLYDVYHQMLSKGDTGFGNVQCTTAKDDCSEEVEHLCMQVEQFITDMQSQKLTKSKEPIVAQLRAEWPLIRSDLVSMDEVLQNEALEVLADFVKGNWGKLKPFVDDVKERISGLEQVMVEMRGAKVLAQIGTILADVHRAYCNAKNSLGLLDFGDLELIAAQLLSKPEVRQDYTFRHLMVDEFQDTNPIQKEIVDQLCANGAVLFIVGDPKQSIYRFRGADVSVFTAAKKEIEESGENVFLKHNFRSVPEIIGFTNEFFHELMENDVIGYESSVSFNEPVGEPRVHCLCTPGGDLAIDEARVLEAQQIALQIRELVDSGKYSYADISLLFRVRTNVRIYEQALQAANIPYVNLSGRGFFSRQEVRDVLNYLAWLADEGNVVAKMAVLRSPFYLVSDDGLYWEQQEQRDHMTHQDKEAVVRAEVDRKELAELAMHSPAPQVITELFNRTGYMETTARLPFGEQKVANVEKLLQQSWDLYARDYVSIADQVRYLNLVTKHPNQEGEAQLDAENADVVVIRTIHGAKGLEFKVVFVPDMNSKLLKPQTNRVLYHPETGLTYKGMAAYNNLKDLATEEELSEARRLLYVAATRAEQELYLCGVELSRKSEGWWKWVEDTLAAVSKSLYTVIPGDKEWTVEQSSSTEPKTIQPKPVTHRQIEPTYTHVPFSVTSLMSYARCPRCYYLRYILGIPEHIRGLGQQQLLEQQIKSTISAIERGNIVHRVCERILDPEQLRALVLSAAAMERVALTDGDIRSIERIIQPYLESDFFQRLQSDQARVYRELDFAIPIGNEFIINGMVDQVFVGSEGLEIVDFKSNWITPEQVVFEGEKYSWQLQTYAWAMEKLFDKKVIQSQAYFLIPNRLYEQPAHTLDATRIEAQIRDACEEIITREQQGITAFPAHPDCTNCADWNRALHLKSSNVG